jgi:hypothetical protein
VVGLWAVEIGGFHGIPSEALMETTGGFVKMQQAREFGFTTELLYCSCRINRRGKRETTTNAPTTASPKPTQRAL